MTDLHKPNPEPRETPELCAVMQTSETITLYEKENPTADITTDFLVEVKE